MFTIVHDLKYIGTDRENIVGIIEAVNLPLVAAEGKPLERARVWIIGAMNPAGSFSIYIYLHLIENNVCQIYLCDPMEITREEYAAMEQEALDFVESMGFIVENTNFRNLSKQHQQEMIDSIPAFFEDINRFAQALPHQASGIEVSKDSSQVDITELSDDILELDESLEITEEHEAVQPASAEDLARMIKLLSSF